MTDRTYTFGGVPYNVVQIGPSSYSVDREGVEMSGFDMDTMEATVAMLVEYACNDIKARLGSLDDEISKLRDKRQMLAAELQELYDVKGDPYHAWRG